MGLPGQPEVLTSQLSRAHLFEIRGEGGNLWESRGGRRPLTFRPFQVGDTPTPTPLSRATVAAAPPVPTGRLPNGGPSRGSHPPTDPHPRLPRRGRPKSVLCFSRSGSRRRPRVRKRLLLTC